MNWLKSRDVIIPTCESFKYFGHNDKFTKQLRNNILSENNYSCRYCGGIYPKYLICIKINQINKIDICCRICYIITHLNYGLFKELKLYYSLMPQLDIIRKTVDFIIKYNEIPPPNKIDENIELTPISLIEFINILNNYDSIPLEFKNYKLFVSNKLNVDFIFYNYGNKSIMFIDENDFIIDTDKIPFDENLKKHIPSDNEKYLLDKFFNNINLNDKMDISIKIAKKVIEKQNIFFSNKAS